jgi:hypothetical protein
MVGNHRPCAIDFEDGHRGRLQDQHGDRGCDKTRHIFYGFLGDSMCFVDCSFSLQMNSIIS